jgi:phosphatidylglycerol:prolipoprotein diacylglycerol transferase
VAKIVITLAIPYPVIDPVLIEIGPFAIRWYALAYIAGIIGGWRYLHWLIRRPGWRVTALDLDDLLLWVTLGIVLGGRVGYVLFYRPGHYLAHPLEALAIWQGGMSFHGGMLGVILAIVLFALLRRRPMFELGDLVACAAPIGLLLGRLVVLFAVLTWFATRPRAPSQAGRLGGIFLVGYGLARTVAELFREPDAHLGFLIGGLTMGQLLSLPMVLFGLWLIVRSTRGPLRAGAPDLG